MTDRNATIRRVRSRPPSGPKATAARSGGDVARDYVSRGRECAFANVRLLGRVVTTFYDEALKPAQLRASQLALLWAILACEPVEMGRLGDVTQTDQTTLSRTVEKLRRAGLVGIARGEDRRVRVLRLTAKGRRQFARAMPLWEDAQRGIARWLSVTGLEDLARQARKLPRAAGDGRAA
jgi:DNA-binding MarR family transcriptional regulator